MTAADSLRDTRTGLWTGALESLPGPAACEAVAELDELGYGSLWFGEAYGREAFSTAQAYLAATRRMVVGTGIANIYGRGAMTTNGAIRLIESLSPGRFVAGLGVEPQAAGRAGPQGDLPATGAGHDRLSRCPGLGALLRGRPRTPADRAGRPRPEDARVWPATAWPAPIPTWSRRSTPPRPAPPSAPIRC